MTGRKLFATQRYEVALAEAPVEDDSEQAIESAVKMKGVDTHSD